MTLARRIGPALLTLYGVGVMVGAGIYVLVGAIAGLAGPATPLAFALAGLTAAFSAWSFAELSARIPRSAGEAAYVEAAFGSVTLATIVGFAVVSVGVVSAAAILKGGVGYLMGFAPLPRAVLEPAVLLGLTLLAMRGVAESLMAAAVLTIVEVAGLIVVAAVGLGATTVTPVAAMLDPSAFAEAGAAAVLSATLLAFFAYVGFEDMVNMAEETVDPARTMPRAILAAVAVTTSALHAGLGRGASRRSASRAGRKRATARARVHDRNGAGRRPDSRHRGGGHPQRGARTADHGLPRALWHGGAPAMARLVPRPAPDAARAPARNGAGRAGRAVSRSRSADRRAGRGDIANPAGDLCGGERGAVRSQAPERAAGRRANRAADRAGARSRDGALLACRLTDWIDAVDAPIASYPLERMFNSFLLR
jgi:hypothetical protein